MSVDTYNITEIQVLDNRDTRLFVDKPDYDCKCAEVADLRARCEKAEKDAERYRHMRGNSQFMDRNGPGLYWYLPRFYNGTPVEQLDKCLDAAIAKEKRP